MSRIVHKHDPQAILRAVREALAAGTHSEHYATACDGCHEWVPAIYHIDGRRRLCFNCAPPNTKPKAGAH